MAPPHCIDELFLFGSNTLTATRCYQSTTPCRHGTTTIINDGPTVTDDDSDNHRSLALAYRINLSSVYHFVNHC